jgi:hypothetical protein
MKDKDSFTATEITITLENSGAVKSATTTTAGVNAEDATSPTEDSNTAHASFIPEDPAPQFIQGPTATNP